MFFTNRYVLSTFIKRCETFKTWWDNVHMLVRKSCEILKNLVVFKGHAMKLILKRQNLNALPVMENRTVYT